MRDFCQIGHDNATLESLMVSTADLSDCMKEITPQEAGDWLDAHGALVVRQAEYTDAANVKHAVEYKTGREILRQWNGWESGQRKP